MNNAIAKTTYEELIRGLEKCRKPSFAQKLHEGHDSGQLLTFWFSLNRYHVTAICPNEGESVQIWLKPGRDVCFGMFPSYYGTLGFYFCNIFNDDSDQQIGDLADMIVQKWLKFSNGLNANLNLFRHIVCNWNDKKAKAEFRCNMYRSASPLLERAHKIWLGLNEDRRKNPVILRLIATNSINHLDTDDRIDELIDTLNSLKLTDKNQNWDLL